MSNLPYILDMDFEDMTKRELASYIVYDMDFKSFIGSFAYGDPNLEDRLYSMSDVKLEKYLQKFTRDQLIDIIANY